MIETIFVMLSLSLVGAIFTLEAKGYRAFALAIAFAKGGSHVHDAVPA